MSTTTLSIAPHFADARQQHESAAFGMWLFLLTEIMLFGGLFTAYTVYRYQHPESFAAGSHHLDLWLGSINTAVLLGSSLTMVLAHQAAMQGMVKRLAAFLSLTILLGAIFLGIKSVEYAHKFEEGLVPGPQFEWETEGGSDEAAPAAAVDYARGVELFFSLYFVMTGAHALHMILGLGILAVLVVLTLAGRQGATAVEMTGLYWHFVDIVWIFLFPLLYLIGRHS